MSEQCGWKVRYLDTGRWKECEEQTAFDDKFCPAHQEIALANEILVSSPIDLLATALLPIVEAFGEGRIWVRADNYQNGSGAFGSYKFIVTPKKEVEESA